jgi:hypothetical protein
VGSLAFLLTFRHTFKRQCRECGIPKDIHDAITGHPSADVADRYGGEYPLKPLADAMRTLRYPGLELAGVKRTPRYPGLDLAEVKVA